MCSFWTLVQIPPKSLNSSPVQFISPQYKKSLLTDFILASFIVLNVEFWSVFIDFSVCFVCLLKDEDDNMFLMISLQSWVPVRLLPPPWGWWELECLEETQSVFVRQLRVTGAWSSATTTTSFTLEFLQTSHERKQFKLQDSHKV